MTGTLDLVIADGTIGPTGKKVRWSETRELFWTSECDRCADHEIAEQLLCDGPCTRPRLSALGGISGQGPHVMPRWRNSGEMVRDIAMSNLPYATDEAPTFDATLGPDGGVFWKHWRPQTLVTNDLNEPADHSWDWTTSCPSELRGKFRRAWLDAPFKGDGNPSMMTGYGLGRTAKVYTAERLDSMLIGMENVAEVLEPGVETYMMVKCQAQQSNNAFQDQPFEVKAHALSLGWKVVTQFHLQYRPFVQEHRGPQRSPGANLSTTVVVAPQPRTES